MLFYTNLQEYLEGEKEKLASLLRANIPECGVIDRVLLPGRDQNKQTNIERYAITQAVKEIRVNYLGIEGDRHYRATRRSTGREKSVYPQGTMIREHRHLLAISDYDCRVLSEMLGVRVTPELLGANLVLRRNDNQDFSLSGVPANTHFIIHDGSNEDGEPQVATLRQYTQQQGCKITGNILAENCKETDLLGETPKDHALIGKFVDAAKTHRGIICSVEQPVEYMASLKAGQRVLFKFPTGITP